ncbi:MAG: NAD(P)-dependent oxidoreductase [Helicobacteraceae bacterium]|jgi:nucleoside-diphosphate-sugar epimerase|nr:NAD(P)-dependent oxidoreductase [Helicobacteraceae bacterium]
MNKIIAEDIQNILSEPLPWEEFSGKTFLITGATSGFLSYVAFALLELKNTNVIVVVRNLQRAQKTYADYLGDDRLLIFEHNLLSPFQRNMLPCIDYFICGAIMSSPKDRAERPYSLALNNIIGTKNLIELAAENTAKTHRPIFMLISSNSVYGQPASDEITESNYGCCDPLSPHASYAESKRIQETMTAGAGVEFDFETRIARYPNVIGPNMILQFGNALHDFINDAINARDIVINSDGLLRREYIYFSDAVGGALYVLLKGANAKPYNIGCQEMITIGNAAKIIAKVFNDIISVKVMGNAYSANTPLRDFRLNASRLNALGWSNKFSLEKAIERTALFYKKDIVN